MAKILSTVALLCASLSLPAAAQPVNPVVQWNRTLLGVVRTPGAQSPRLHPSRSFAIMHAAIFDAVDAIDGTHEPYAVALRGTSSRASQEAAAATAAHEVLVALYPAFRAMLDTQLQASLAEVPDGAAKTQGTSIGQTVADRILELRRDDGSDAEPPPFVFGTTPGGYQSTPPNFPAQPQLTHWAGVTPFALQSAGQFRPGPPPAVTSHAYGAALAEVMSLGVAGSTTATADEALAGRFWNGAIQNYWNEIAQTPAVAGALGTAESARLFALLNVSLADAVIAFYDAKYTYDFWRPVIAVREAATDGNDRTVANPDWRPEVTNTTPDPSYPGAHAVISAAGAAVLISFFGHDRFDFDVTSEVLPGVTRSFTRFSAAAREATASRIFAGVHFRFDLVKGGQLGRRVAKLVDDTLLRSVHHHG